MFDVLGIRKHFKEKAEKKRIAIENQEKEHLFNDFDQSLKDYKATAVELRNDIEHTEQRLRSAIVANKWQPVSEDAEKTFKKLYGLIEELEEFEKEFSSKDILSENYENIEKLTRDALKKLSDTHKEISNIWPRMKHDILTVMTDDIESYDQFNY